MSFVSRSFRRSLLLLLGGLLFPALTASAAGWEPVRHDGRDYVTVRSIRDFYKFQSMKVNGSFLELENRAVKIRFSIGGQEVFMNNVKFVFSFKVIPHQGRYLVSRIDLGKLVDPVLRPSYIKTSNPSTPSSSIPVTAATTRGQSINTEKRPTTILPSPVS